MVTHKLRTHRKLIWVISGLFSAKPGLQTYITMTRGFLLNYTLSPDVFIKAWTVERDPVSVCWLFKSLAVSSEYAAYKRATVLHTGPRRFSPWGSESRHAAGGKWPWWSPRAESVRLLFLGCRNKVLDELWAESQSTTRVRHTFFWSVVKSELLTSWPSCSFSSLLFNNYDELFHKHGDYILHLQHLVVLNSEQSKIKQWNPGWNLYHSLVPQFLQTEPYLPKSSKRPKRNSPLHLKMVQNSSNLRSFITLKSTVFLSIVESCRNAASPRC